MRDRLQYLRSLPKKNVSAGVLLQDPRERLLIVKPRYSTYWSVPGGVVEQNESPLEAALRETQEEIGLKPRILRCAGIAYTRRHFGEEWVDGLQVLFWGASLTEQEIQNLRPQTEELETLGFFSWSEALRLLNPPLARRLRWICRYPDLCVYLENDRPINGLPGGSPATEP